MATLKTLTKVIDTMTIEKDVKQEFLTPLEWKSIRVNENSERQNQLRTCKGWLASMFCC